jgi:EmrB/QacA subfamily drug resistance transporter
VDTPQQRDAAVAIADPDLEGIDPRVYRRRWKTLAVLCTSLLIIIVGNTVLNVALPTMSRPDQLGASNTELQWIVDAYGLVFAGLLFSAGALGDRFGRKGALQLGLLVFASGSLFGALADTSGQVIAARAIMGAGAAFVMPSTLSILTNVFPSRERLRAIAIWAGISGAGAAIGPLASGLLLEHYWWGSVFLVNIPIVALALGFGAVLVPRSKDRTATPLDPLGALLSIIGMSALVYAIIEGPRHGWVSVESLIWFGGAAVAIGLFVLWESTTKHPMLDLKLFKDRRFAVASGGITLTFFALFGTFYMMTQYLQFVLDYTPLEAAVRLVPVSVVLMAVAPQTPKLVGRFGADRVASTGLGLVALALALTATFTTHTPYWYLLITIVLLGGGMAMTMTPMTTQLMSAVPRDRAGIGSAMNDTTRELGGALGVAVLGSLVTSQYTSGVSGVAAQFPAQLQDTIEASIGGVHGLIDQGAIPAELASGLLTTAKQAFVDGFGLAATVGAVIVFATAIAVRRLLPSDRRNSAVAGEAEAVTAAAK